MKAVLLYKGKVVKRAVYPNKFGDEINNLEEGHEWQLVEENDIPKIDSTKEKLIIDESATNKKHKKHTHLNVFKVNYKVEKLDQESIDDNYKEILKINSSELFDTKETQPFLIKGLNILFKLSRGENLSVDEDEFIVKMENLYLDLETITTTHKIQKRKAKK